MAPAAAGPSGPEMQLPPAPSAAYLGLAAAAAGVIAFGIHVFFGHDARGMGMWACSALKGVAVCAPALDLGTLVPAALLFGAASVGHAFLDELRKPPPPPPDDPNAVETVRVTFD